MTSQSQPDPRTPPLGVLLGLVFLSGAAGLMIEVVFTRRLVQVFGSTSEAVATVLAAFMAGFAIGAAIWGRVADRFEHPVRVYAALEVAIGGAAVGLYLSLPALHPLFQQVYDLSGRRMVVYTSVRFLVLGFLLLLPTTCMGATLPVLAAAVSGTRRVGRDVGLIYAVNTAGAVAGTLLAGFVLVEVLGMTRTVLVAAVLNLLAAGGVVLLLRDSRRQPISEAPSRAAAPLRREALTATFLSGFCALGFEVVWTRILIFYITGTTYAFSTMLATFLVGISLGSFLFAPPRRSRDEAASRVGLGPRGSQRSSPWGSCPSSRSSPRAGVYPRPEGPGWVEILAGQFGQCFAVMILPTICIGGTFPVVCRMVAGTGRTGADVGVVYSTNTVGAILGSVLTGFVPESRPWGSRAPTRSWPCSSWVRASG